MTEISEKSPHLHSSNESEALASQPEKPMEINGQREQNPGESACHEISVTFCHYIIYIYIYVYIYIYISTIITHPLRKE